MLLLLFLSLPLIITVAAFAMMFVIVNSQMEIIQLIVSLLLMYWSIRSLNLYSVICA